MDSIIIIHNKYDSDTHVIVESTCFKNVDKKIKQPEESFCLFLMFSYRY